MYPMGMGVRGTLGDVEVAVLPLYSFKKAGKFVPEKSGINQWNAGGRVRQFGEAYISVPATFRDSFQNFFPARDVTFTLELPSGREVKAKICQQGGKALMTSPNSEMCNWLFPLLDGSIENSIRRFVSKKPYSYDDLANAGFDSVSLRHEAGTSLFSIEIAAIGSYERQWER